MDNTKHYNLKKPGKTDVINIDDLNCNADIIDGELNKRALKTEIPTTLPANGGNSDTIGGKGPSAFATAQQGIKADTALQSDKLGKLGGAAKHDQLISDYYKKNEVEGKISSEVGRVDAQLAEIVSQVNGKAPLSHTHTKSQVGLSAVNNWGATSSVSDSSTSKYATARGVKIAYDKGVEALNKANTKLNSSEVSSANGGNKVVRRDSSGDVACRLLRQEYPGSASDNGNYFLTQNACGAGADNYARPITKARARAILGVPDIVISTTQPSNPVEGMIWLEPK